MKLQFYFKIVLFFSEHSPILFYTLITRRYFFYYTDFYVNYDTRTGMLRDNKLRRLNTDPCLPMLSEGAANRSDLPKVMSLSSDPLRHY